jgi:hypothetical protein
MMRSRDERYGNGAEKQRGGRKGREGIKLQHEPNHSRVREANGWK